MKTLLSIFITCLATIFVSNNLFENPGAIEFISIGGGGLALSLLIPKMSGIAFDTIGLDAARGALTNIIAAIYNEATSPPTFLSSFFPAKFHPTKLISFEVKRGTEKIAVDILRGTGTNLNKKSRSSLKTLEPPLYAEGFNVNELDVYDTAFGTLDPVFMAQLANESAETLVELKNKILRAYEKQGSEVFKSGVITLNSGDNIDFRRKAESMVDGGAGTYWTVATVDPTDALETGGQFLREEGKAQGGVYNVIMGGSAYNAMINNPVFQKQYDLRRVELGEIHEPQRISTGGTLHGKLSRGSYTYHIWTYPEGYENAAGDFVKYLDVTDIYMVPEITNFETSHALVPQLPGMTPMRETDGGAYVFNEYLDQKNRNHTQEILSAGAVLPIAIDQLWNAKVTAT
jgi:hypothetical protein